MFPLGDGDMEFQCWLFSKIINRVISIYSLGHRSKLMNQEKFIMEKMGLDLIPGKFPAEDIGDF